MIQAKDLSPKQKKVIKCLQGDYVLITSSAMKGAIVGNRDVEFHINNRIFKNLVDKGLIVQGYERQGFSFILTDLGKSITL